MSQTFKKLISTIIVFIALGMAYFGAYLPLRKGQLIIEAMRSLGSVKTVQDLENVLSEPLDFYSPVGQDESVRQVSAVISGILSKQKTMPQDVAVVLINFVVGYFDPIISSGHGGNFSQDFLTLGQIYQTAGMNYNSDVYLNKAVEYYKRGLDYSPNRPQFLYNLLNIYIAQNDLKSAKEIGDIILKNWPQDEKIQEIVSKIKL